MIEAAAAEIDGLAGAVGERERVLTEFLETEQARLAQACHDLARAFARGGLLIASGSGPAATDAAHVAVEFMHPVIMGKRALPAVAPTNDPNGAGGVATLARSGDILLALAHGPADEGLDRLLEGARAGGLLTIALTGQAPASGADHAFAVPSADPAVVQEVQETAYHVLWELVHVFFEHRGLLDDACITCGDVAVEARVAVVHGASALIEHEGLREEVATDLVEDLQPGDLVLCHAGVVLERLAAGAEPSAADAEPTAFLYPFLGGERSDLDRVMADVRASTIRKGAETSALRRAIDLEALNALGEAVSRRLDDGARLFVFGNGGSSTDAQDLAADCLARGRPALCLTNDVATVTAVGNDVGFDNVFARQLIALGREGDVALGISTSGSSGNVVAALAEARASGMLTCALTGYDGGRLAESRLDHLLVVHSDDIPRLQEVHATIYHLLVELIARPG